MRCGHPLRLQSYDPALGYKYIQMTHRLPNLFLIGAMKSGTTSLHAYLNSHPQIFMSGRKEPAFFAKEPACSNSEESYLSLFATVRDELIVGESSTSYTKAPHHSGVPNRIAKFNPEARFIYIMRDPVERTISHYWFNVRYFGERRDMLTAIRDDPRYQNVSNYPMQLAPYRDLFGPDRIATITFEELVGDTLSAVQKLFIFLGVDSSVVPQNLERRANVTPEKLPVIRNQPLDRLLRAPATQLLKPVIPSPLVSLTRRLLRRYKYIDRKKFSVDDVVEFLKPVQAEQIRFLSEMLGRQFPEWTCRYAVVLSLLWIAC